MIIILRFWAAHRGIWVKKTTVSLAFYFSNYSTWRKIINIDAFIIFFGVLKADTSINRASLACDIKSCRFLIRIDTRPIQKTVRLPWRTSTRLNLRVLRYACVHTCASLRLWLSSPLKTSRSRLRFIRCTHDTVAWRSNNQILSTQWVKFCIVNSLSLHHIS